ncbi:hypothetical protein [Alcaligenes faecalis]|uniref:Guanylate cyclase domain-containing protein n=1 Tax=Alcaligenes faecalis TaxID=511 RepID=A0ABY7MX21_ALCFA|nr:hypothetical protein [Alcaligenes faecalis]WBM36419.1 hypothetical protein M2J83_11360 [Alcaligenes faecalis]
MTYYPIKKNGRYLLFLDILGFSQLVETRGHQEVYITIEKALDPFRYWEQLNGCFQTIYFSDTFVFYQESTEFHPSMFLDIYAIGGMVLSALLAQGIPARGAISFGEFNVNADSSGRHQLYFGRAMIEAYRAEQREKWIGITILPSAWRPYEESKPGVIDLFACEGVWLRRADDVLLLNPFVKLSSWGSYIGMPGEMSPPYSKIDENLTNDLLGLKFLRDTAQGFADKNEFLSPEAVKYHTTILFLKKVLGARLFDWAEYAVQPENF